MTTLVFDIEADGFLDVATRVWCISIIDTDQPETVSTYHGQDLGLGVARLQSADVLVAHNGIAYDVPMLNKHLNANLDLHKMHDTLVLSRLGMPERVGGHSLESWGEYLKFPKVEHDEWDRFSPEMVHRCEVDTQLNLKVYQRLFPMFTKMPVACHIEHKTAIAIARMCRNGVCFNEAKAYELLEELLVEEEEYMNEVRDLLGYRYKVKGTKGAARCLKKPPNKNHWGRGILEAGVEYTEVILHKLSPTSRQDVAWYFMNRYKWVPTQKTKTGQPKVDEEVLGGMPWDEAVPIAKLFTIQKLLGYLNGEIKMDGKGGGWLHHVTAEGKLHANFIPLTAVTGRPSCAAPNLQQVPTDKRARALFGPRPGWKQVGVDADGQELRCLGHYLHPYDGGEYAREVVEGDIHSRIQRAIGFETRDGTKPVEYGLIYGAGNPKLGLISLKDKMSVGKRLTRSLKREGERIRRAILDTITGYEDLVGDVRLKAGQVGRLRGLDGRTLWVRSAHSALNLLLQSAGIIHMKMTISLIDGAMEKAGLVYGEDWALTLWVHDELQFEARPEVAELVGKTAAACVEEAAKLLKFRLPMTGGYMVGDNWSETH